MGAPLDMGGGGYCKFVLGLTRFFLFAELGGEQGLS